jgi:capsular polysaccharide transport system ATP-binding protein
MIILDGVTHVALAGEKKRKILTAVQLMLPPDRRIAILGPEAEDKKAFLNLLAGLVLPSSGRVVRESRLSFPPGYLGGFTRTLSVRLNVAHVARLYGADVDSVVHFVAQVSKLGEDFNKLYGDLPVAKRRSLSEILAFSIPFDVYLLNDDVVRPDTSKYNKDARALFEARAKPSGMIIASQDEAFAREFCDMGLVLVGGRVRLFKNLDRAFSFLEEKANREDKANLEEKAKNPRLKAREERQKLKRKANKGKRRRESGDE